MVMSPLGAEPRRDVSARPDGVPWVRRPPQPFDRGGRVMRKFGRDGAGGRAKLPEVR